MPTFPKLNIPEEFADLSGSPDGNPALKTALEEFVAGSFTPSLGDCPRIVPQYNWPVDDYTILVAWVPDPTDVTGDIILDMTTGSGSSTLGLRVRMASTFARILYFLGPTSIRSADIDISDAVTNGYEVRIALRRKGTSADYSYQIDGGTEVIGTYDGTATFVDMPWPETIGLGSDSDGNNQTGNPLSEFRIAHGQWYLEAVGQDIDDQTPPVVVFDGRDLGAPNTDNAAYIADADQDTHGIERGDIAFYHGGALHSVQRSGLAGSGITVQSGSNATGHWQVTYNTSGDIIRVDQWMDITTSSGGYSDFAWPISMPDENYTCFGNITEVSSVVVIKLAYGGFTASTARVATARTDVDSYLSFSIRVHGVWIA